VAARTTSRLAALALLLGGCGLIQQLPSPRPAISAVAAMAGGDTVSTEYAPPGIFTRAQGAYMTFLLELNGAASVTDDLPDGDLGVVVVDQMGDDVKLARSLADELVGLGRNVARLKLADLDKKEKLPPTILWVIPRAGGIESAALDEFSYEASVRVVAVESATGNVIFSKTIERSSVRDRVSDILGVLDKN